MDRIVISGSLAQRPGRGGHTWVFLQYLLGFRRLGWDVLFLDRLEPGMCEDASGRPAELSSCVNVPYLREVMDGFELGDAYALLDGEGRSVAGRSRHEVLDFTRSAALFVDVMGYSGDEELLGSARRTVFLDIDPGFPQVWKALGLHDPFVGYDDHVTVGLNVGRPDCLVPTGGIDWITTPQPVVLDLWDPRPARSGPFTSVVTWRGDMGPLEFEGRRLGLRVHEFRRFLDLPHRTGWPFELALDIHPDETGDLALLAEGGWALVDPLAVSGDPWSYREYIRGSGCEFMVAKNLYVETRSGWFSDRSICYLASGRPVLAQDTGLRDHLPADEGLVLFSDPDEAEAGVHALVADPRRHGEAARQIAEERFGSDRVLGDLLDSLSDRRRVAAPAALAGSRG